MRHVACYALLILSGACTPEAPTHSAPEKAKLSTPQEQASGAPKDQESSPPQADMSVKPHKPEAGANRKTADIKPQSQQVIAAQPQEKDQTTLDNEKPCKGTPTDEWRAQQIQIMKEIEQAGQNARLLQRAEDYERLRTVIDRSNAFEEKPRIMVCRTTLSTSTAKATWEMYDKRDKVTAEAISGGRIPDEYYCDKCKKWMQQEILSDLPNQFEWRRL